MRLFNALLLCGLLGIAVAADTCGKCMTDSQALCLNETYYELCDGDVSITPPAKCRSGYVCTNSPNICEANPDGKNIRNVCNDNDNDNDLGGCSTCKTANSFICVSPTQYSRCNAALKQIGLIACPEEEFCSEEFFKGQKQMCAPNAVLEYFKNPVTCSNSEIPATTTTTEAPSKDLEEQCYQSFPDHYGEKYFYIRNKDDCRSYIYCEFIGSRMEAILLICKSGLYYGTNGKCVTDEPSECKQSIPSTPKTNTETEDGSGFGARFIDLNEF